MIAYINGKLVIKEPTHVIIDVNGIGYHINISLYTYGAIPESENYKLYTYLHVKEDSHTLFGFHTTSERAMFLALISISGVGPTTGLMVQSSLNPAELQRAIMQEDVNTIQSVKGIGAKTAQRIILELKDKISKAGIEIDPSDLVLKSNNTTREEALSALLTLGINKSAAERSLDFILKNTGTEITLEELIKRALKST